MQVSLITGLFVWFVFEIVTASVQGLYHYIKGNGRVFLEKELSDCSLNTVDRNMISLKGMSELNGSYISTTSTSIIFPYYLLNKDNISYGILLFSKEYFIVKNKFKELRQISHKNKRIKFTNK